MDIERFRAAQAEEAAADLIDATAASCLLVLIGNAQLVESCAKYPEAPLRIARLAYDLAYAMRQAGHEHAVAEDARRREQQHEFDRRMGGK